MLQTDKGAICIKMVQIIVQRSYCDWSGGLRILILSTETVLLSGEGTSLVCPGSLRFRGEPLWCKYVLYFDATHINYRSSFDFCYIKFVPYNF